MTTIIDGKASAAGIRAENIYLYVYFFKEK